MEENKHTAGGSGCSNPECACVPFDGGPLASERMPWQVSVDCEGWPMVHNIGDVICVPDPNHHAGCAWDLARFHLIAAAPEMFEALEQLLGNAELARFHLQATEEGMIVGSALFDTVQQARAALAKAKGPSK